MNSTHNLASPCLHRIDKRGTPRSPGPQPGLIQIISASELDKQINATRKWFRQMYAHRDLTLIPIQKGGNAFFGDIYLNGGAQYASLMWSLIIAQSGGRAESLEDVEVDDSYLKTSEIFGRDCVILDDVFDSGYTLEAVRSAVQARQPASLRILTVIEKDRPRTCLVRPTESLFLIPNVWVCGYGLDGGDERHRQLRCICEVLNARRIPQVEARDHGTAEKAGAGL